MSALEDRIVSAREALGGYDTATLPLGIVDLLTDLAHLLEQDTGKGGIIVDLAYKALLHFEYEQMEVSR